MPKQDYETVSRAGSESCTFLSPNLCQMVNVDAYTLILAIWVSLQLTWVLMLLFTQSIQIARALTTYENMYGILDTAATTAFTSTGHPLDPSHSSISGAGAGAGHMHRPGKFKQWSRVLGIDPFIETIAGRGAATGKRATQRKNPYTRGCVANCKDFWCDSEPVFGKRENGKATLGGHTVDYTAMYESPRLMQATGRRGREGYEAVGTDEDV